MRYLIYGAGSLGTVLGAYLTNANLNITLVNRNEAHVKALNENGAKVIGKVNLTSKVKAILPSEMEGKYDVIFLMTKQQENEAICEFLKEYLKEDSTVVVLQNGIPEPKVKEILGDNRVLGAVVEWGAKLTSPGIVTQTSDISANIIKLENNKSVSIERRNLIKDVLSNMCLVTLEDNMMGVRFSKLLINATFTGIGTSINGLFMDVYKDKIVKEVAIRSVKECIDVANALGVKIEKVQGIDIAKLFYYKSNIKKTFSKCLMPIALKKHGLTEPSMLQDIKKGKHSEIDFVNGLICKYGKEAEVPTPINDRIVEIVKGIENGNIPLSRENAKLYMDLIN